MTTDVVALDVGLSLREALEVLRADNVSGAPVVRGESVVGVLSATDILEFAATTPGVPTGRSDEGGWDDLTEAQLWSEGEEAPDAFFADFWVDAGADVTARIAEPDTPEWDLLSDRTVSDVMTRKVVAVAPDSSVHDAARVMLDAGVHRVLVIEEGQLCGILSGTDVVRA
ncbi:MAG: CBS domain-containing protein, partial [Actinobacteria bacterium]|nr:CBS domain-containing protein [Actinomycetota bacterium]NIS32322.1 CBS domain-containing protein [Actinomycetota bacterium]NIU67352.1 CBS domain-containing protein [Actinomycetota bacterium]NIV87853.1 CBS domain-containing protein [Actinomycetota bacterium]NIW29131.1 CBS domain-containing protein [Actinomycetota bacterium]